MAALNPELVVIGTSAGGLAALQRICAGFPPDLDAAVLVVIHTSASSAGMIPTILDRAGPLKAKMATPGEVIRKGMIYVAPPDYHMVVEDHTLQLIRGPRENRHRPAIDPTFRSAALAYGERVIGIVLTGALDDGTSGLMVVRAHGGAAIVQDPATAEFPSMPASALNMVSDAHVARLEDIPALIVKLLAEPRQKPKVDRAMDAQALRDIRMAELDMTEVENDLRSGNPSVFGCPECGGVLSEIKQANLVRFRCRVGHAYTAKYLAAEQRFAIETALWSALRALEESASLYKRLAAKADEANLKSFRSYEDQVKTAEQNAHTLRDFLVNIKSLENPSDSPEQITAA